MQHIIGPKTGHKYEAKARETVAKLVDQAVANGRNLIPKKIRFITYTLRYNRMHWVTIDALEQHWEQARVDAELTPEGITLSTRNVAAITLSPKNLRSSRPRVTIDGQVLAAPRGVPLADWSISYRKIAGKWSKAKALSGLVKKHGLQGPIDDAFMDSFVFVKPDDTGWHSAVDEWVLDELADARFQWRRQMRGDSRVKSVAEVNADDIANSHLVLWGDPSSNSLLARLLPLLPLEWTKNSLSLAGREFDSKTHAAVLVFPNPLNPEKYMVLNSGMTYAHWGSASNSRQTPKLPDWAVLDVNVAAPKRLQGNGVAAAGFFDESWR